MATELRTGDVASRPAFYNDPKIRGLFYQLLVLALVVVEVIRNIPVLLQLIFWYSVVLASLPTRAGDALSLGGIVFLYVRGAYVPRPIFGPGSSIIFYAFVLAIVAVGVLSHWAR